MLKSLQGYPTHMNLPYCDPRTWSTARGKWANKLSDWTRRKTWICAQSKGSSQKYNEAHRTKL